MIANTSPTSGLTLGAFLRDRRARVSPGPGANGRRRTPGLRREEVAARAGVSVTWYTWLEQGRGGPPSAEVLEQLVGALELDAAAREVLFLLAQQRPPPLKRAPSPAVVPPGVQRVLDALTYSPACVKTAVWDIVAWNAAAAAVLTDYAELPSGERNALRRLFTVPGLRASMPDWETDARFALAAFRVDLARAGNSPEAAALTAELHAASADFRRLWAENEIRSEWFGRKHFRHPIAGSLALDYSSYAIEGGGGQSMIVFTPATPADEAAIASLLADGQALSGATLRTNTA